MRNCIFWGIVFGVLIVVAFVVVLKTTPDKHLFPKSVRPGNPFCALAFNANDPEKVFKFWDDETKAELRKNLAWDFVFIPIYTLLLGLACYLVSQCLNSPRWIFASRLMIGLVLLGAFIDVSENVALLQIIRGLHGPWVVLAQLCTRLKFVFPILALVYIAIGGGTCIFNRFIR